VRTETCTSAEQVAALSNRLHRVLRHSVLLVLDRGCATAIHLPDRYYALASRRQWTRRSRRHWLCRPWLRVRIGWTRSWKWRWRRRRCGMRHREVRAARRRPRYTFSPRYNRKCWGGSDTGSG